MGKSISAISVLSAAPAALLLASGTAMAADQSIEQFEAAQQTAWNAHDASAYTAAFDTNAEIVTSLGWHWTGQAEAASNLGDGFKLVYIRAHLRIADVQVRALTPELASVTLSWSIDGARTIDGGLQAGEQHGFETQLLQRRGEGWLILSQQDTTTTAAPLPALAQSPVRAPQPVAAFPVTPPPVRRCIMARKDGECLIYGKARPAPAP